MNRVKKQPVSTRENKGLNGELIELRPDAEKRFEKAVDMAAKAKPVRRDKVIRPRTNHAI